MTKPPRPLLIANLWALARRELAAVSALLVVTLAGMIFLQVADEVSEGETQAIDRALLLSLRTPGDSHDPIGPKWLEHAAADFTSLGSLVILGVIVVFAAGLFATLGRRREAIVLTIASVGGVAISQGLKQLFGRVRPDIDLRAVEAMNPSFPSGHAMMTAVVFLTLGVLCARFLQSRPAKIWVLSLAILVTIMVGLTRIYLGVHWPSDVLAGWCLGAAWALICWLCAFNLQRFWPKRA